MKCLKKVIACALAAAMMMTAVPTDTYAASSKADASAGSYTAAAVSAAVSLPTAAAAASKGKVTSVTVTSPSVSTLVLKKGAKYTIKTKVETSGKKADKSLTYKSSNSKIVTVSSSGKMTAVKGGNATITVVSKADSKKYDTFKVVVDVPVTKLSLNMTSVKLAPGKSAALKVKVSPSNAKIKTVKYTTSNKAVATVDQNGKIKAVGKGKATITVTSTDGSNKSAKCTVKVEPIQVSKVVFNKTALTLKVGSAYQLTAAVTPDNATDKSIKYASSNSKIAKVDSKGKVTAVSVGSAVITATANDGSKKSAKCTVKVEPIQVSKVAFDKTALTLEIGSAYQLKTTVTPDNAADKSVKYASSDSKVAKVDSKGKVTAVAAGSAVITATANDGSKKTAKCNVTVEKESDYYDAEDTFDYNLKDTKDIETNASVEGYSASMLKWYDNFEGEELNTDDWNVETHEAGWVNSELQSYVNDSKNIFVEDGNLVLRPTRHEGENGDTFESGRVNTQGKHDFTYGLFEARVKVPEGQGFLPAFWMMPTDENLYGQWPRCGEIDAMEVMGQDTSKVYGTIHYGNPHAENQGTKTITGDKSFSDEYHVFACEWNPGKITWYVDGEEYYSTSNWYSRTIGQGKVSYPAPFDQPFYMILNLAVGGSWVGNPDENTKINPAAYVIDYVRVYQKDSYDEDVEEPENETEMREPDENGNYVINGDFSENESLTDDEGWKFMTAQKGEAAASIANNTMTIDTKAEGDVNYSVQLVQAGIPLEEGAKYQVTFDAKAASDRTMNCAVKAPSLSYYEHMSQEVSLTSEYQTYSYEFTMGLETDPSCRLEFNMGKAGSTAKIEIRNVAVKKISDGSSGSEAKTVLADGNLIYNGSFQEGSSRLGYWTVTKGEGAEAAVTSLSDGRRLHVTGSGVSIAQEDLCYDESTAEYLFTMDAENASKEDAVLTFDIFGKEYSAEVAAGETKTVSQEVKHEDITTNDITIRFPDDADIKIDNVRLEENCKIKNGSFNGGTVGYEFYADSSASASFVVDSLNEDNAADITVKDTGDQDWKIQLKQNNVKLENGKCYKLTFKAKSSLDRKIRVIMQGGESKKWNVYSGENTVDVASEYQTYEKKFEMTADTDDEAFLSICLGAVGGKQITEQHRVCIDDISLTEIDPSEMPQEDTGDNLLKNAGFTSSTDNWTITIANWDNLADASYTTEDGKIIFTINNPGSEDWHVQLKQSGIKLESGKTYKASYKISSTKARSIKSGIMSASYVWYGGRDPDLSEYEEKSVSYEFTMTADDNAADFYISLGAIKGKETPGSVVTISELSLVEEDEEGDDGESISAEEEKDAEGSFEESEDGEVISEETEEETEIITDENGSEETEVISEEAEEEEPEIISENAENEEPEAVSEETESMEEAGAEESVSEETEAITEDVTDDSVY